VKRNPHYYDPACPYLDGVKVVVYPDGIAESSALISGDTDLMLSAQSSEFARLSRLSGVLPLRVASGQFLNVNMGCPLTMRACVRRWLCVWIAKPPWILSLTDWVHPATIPPLMPLTPGTLI